MFRYRMLSDQDISQTINGSNGSVNQKIGFEYLYSIASVDADGNTWADIEYTWVLYEQKTLMNKVAYDSSNPPAEVPPEALGYSVMVGKGFSILISPDGEVVEVEGLDELYDAVLDELDIDDWELRQQLELLLETSFGEEAIKESCGELVFSSPDEPIRVGESWSVTVERSLPIPIVVENEYTLRDYDGKIATFDVFSTIVSSEEGMMDIVGVQLGYAVSGTQEGFIEVDTESGLTLTSEISQDISGEAIVIYDGEEMRIPLEMKSVTTLSIIFE